MRRPAGIHGRSLCIPDQVGDKLHTGKAVVQIAAIQIPERSAARFSASAGAPGSAVYSLSWRPLHVELALGGRTVPQVKVDKALVRDVGLLRHFLEVLNHVRAHPEGNVFLELLGVGIRPGLHLRQVVFVFHVTISCKIWLRSP